MTISDIKIVDIKTPDKPNHIRKIALDTITNKELGKLEADFFDNGKRSYCGAKFTPFYTSDLSNSSSVANKHINVADLFVPKEARKQGIGKKLIQSLVKDSIDRGCEGRIVLLAGCNEASPLPFYRKIGFATTNSLMNKKLDEAIKFKYEIDKTIQAFMFLTKDGIKKLLKTIR